MPSVQLGKRTVGLATATYFIADLAANHDGSLERAIDLIEMAAASGADAAKFQNFRAQAIVSDYGFRQLDGKQAHQAKWRKTVFEVYQDAALPWEWTERLKVACEQAGLDYFSSPYDFESVDMLEPYVAMYKIGSGDINWPEMLLKIASKEKPVLLATGASDIGDVQRAVHTIQTVNPNIVLMQCNTNYTGSIDNFRYINLNVLSSYSAMFPNVVLGLSDHTPGHATVLGAVALGARVIEKHFTDDTAREGPDHGFSMSPTTWRDMVDRTRELELALGSADKRVEENEQDTVVIQRRCLRAARDLQCGTVLCRGDIEVLRPAVKDGIAPYELDRVLGRRLLADIASGDRLSWASVGETVV